MTEKSGTHSVLLLLLTFENQSSSHQFGELQTVQRENIVEDDGPEVSSVENTSDPARHGFTHQTLGRLDRVTL